MTADAGGLPALTIGSSEFHDQKEAEEPERELVTAIRIVDGQGEELVEHDLHRLSAFLGGLNPLNRSHNPVAISKAPIGESSE